MSAVMTQAWLSPTRPMSIAHRGASAYALANSLRAFQVAADLGADMWEVDLHQTLDGVIVAFHDATLADGRALADVTQAELREALPEGEAVPFSEIIDLALQTNTGIYADIKAWGCAAGVSRMLQDKGVTRAILAAFDPRAVAALKAANSPYPRSVLVPVGVDPFAVIGEADIIHPCWEAMERPQDLLDQAFFARCDALGKKVVLWHEEDPSRMAELRGLPVLGICSDRPELVNPVTFHPDWQPQVICHRGANKIAPENTLSAGHCAFSAGFSHFEIDVHITADGELVVHHDPTLDRTTNGTGALCDRTLEELRRLDAGSWFSPHFSAEKLPTLDEVLKLAGLYGGQLYIEFKSAPAKLVWDRVVAHGMQDRCFFWSFVTETLRDLRGYTAEARIMVRRQDFVTLQETRDFLSPALIEYTVNDPWEDFDLLQKSGLAVMIAYNGADEDVFDKIITARPDMVNIDQPFMFARISAAKGLTIDR
ncbi:MAG: hypothetical protein HRU33_02025 [Rhodobacteraceae bacterium]|nr:hypothetical protein [Paracoccaceae bacterium]